MKASELDIQHFTGTVVYIEDTVGSRLNEVLIIDGQQRITTVYILLQALYDATKNISARIRNEIHDVMFNRNCKEEYKVKLKPVKSDNQQLLLLISGKIDDMDRNSNVYKNYITFKKLIDDTLKEGNKFEDILEGIKQLEIVEIILDKSQKDKPQKIFESINSTGLELSLADLIRNYLLMDDENQDELYNEYWLEIEKNVEYENLENFFINFLNSQINKTVNVKNAYRLFQEYCEEKESNHKEILSILKQISKYYGAFIGTINPYENEIAKYLKAFATIKQTTVLPFIFRIFNDFENKHISKNDLCNVLEYLLTYLIRIISCERSNNLAKFMKSLYIRAINSEFNNYSIRFMHS